MPGHAPPRLPFPDRESAGRELARRLAHLSQPRPLVLGIPRGAVPMARVIADALGADLDVVLVRKLGSPWNPELAVGAVDESGRVYVAPHSRRAGGDEEWIAAESARQLQEISRRRQLYTPDREPIDAHGRTVIVVDDGAATGSTLIAALQAVRTRQPARVVCALPVASREAATALSKLADELVCLAIPEPFDAVGAFYRHFPQLRDQDVVAALRH